MFIWDPLCWVRGRTTVSRPSAENIVSIVALCTRTYPSHALLRKKKVCPRFGVVEESM